MKGRETGGEVEEIRKQMKTQRKIRGGEGEKRPGKSEIFMVEL